MAGHRNIPLTFLDIAIFDVRLPIAQLANNIERQTAGTTDRCQAIAAIFSGTVAPLIVIYLFIFFVLWRRFRKIVGVIKQNNITKKKKQKNKKKPRKRKTKLYFLDVQSRA